MNHPARLLAEVKNACGDRAVAAAERDDHTSAREWRAVAMECDRLLRDAVAALAAEARRKAA